MKRYNDIGDLYREKFADYTPEPPASVWEGLQSAIQKKPSLWKKLTFPSAGIVIVGAAIYLLFANPKPQESAIDTVRESQKNTENKIVNNEALPAANLSDKLEAKNTSALLQKNSVNSEKSSETQPTKYVSLLTDNSFISNSTEETSQSAEERIAVDKKSMFNNEEQSQRQNAVKQTQNESSQPKGLPIKISKDTMVCENAAVKLYVYNAENIRWSTGETENIITLHPSYSEQYSVTFSKTNTKDTTIYIYVNVVPCAEVHIPNAFTPNGDGLNDVFLAQTDIELRHFEMIIYAADGRHVLFTSKDIKHGWDGTYKGQPQPHGVYFYTIRYTDNLGKTIEKNGELLLILQI